MKTTAKHFKIFKKEVEEWLPVFGLASLSISIVHEDDAEKLARAWCNIVPEDNLYIIGLSKDWSDDKITVNRIKRGAFHEVFHAKFGAIHYKLFKRGYTDEEIKMAIHDIIIMFENWIYGND